MFGGSAGSQAQARSMLPGQLAAIILRTVFLFIGLTACSIAAVRGWSGVRLFIWLGIWSAMYGAAIVDSLPHTIQISVPYLNTVDAYLFVVVALLAILELSLKNCSGLGCPTKTEIAKAGEFSSDCQTLLLPASLAHSNNLSRVSVDYPARPAAATAPVLCASRFRNCTREPG